MVTAKQVAVCATSRPSSPRASTRPSWCSRATDEPLTGAAADAAVARLVGRPARLQVADGASFADVAPVHVVSRQAVERAAAEEGTTLGDPACSVEEPRANVELDLSGGELETAWVGPRAASRRRRPAGQPAAQALPRGLRRRRAAGHGRGGGRRPPRVTGRKPLRPAAAAPIRSRGAGERRRPTDQEATRVRPRSPCPSPGTSDRCRRGRRRPSCSRTPPAARSRRRRAASAASCVTSATC